MALVGCGPHGCDSSGIEALADFSPRNVLFPGKTLGTLALDEEPLELLGEQGIPSAIVTRNPRNELNFYHFDDSAPCGTASIAEVGDPIAGDVSESVENWLAYVSRVDDANTELHFIDASCRESVPPLRNATLVGRPSHYSPARFVALSDDGKLHVIRPDLETQTVIGRSVTKAISTVKYLFTIEDGAVTIRKRSLEIVQTFGTLTTEIHVDKATDQVAFIDSRGVGYWTGMSEAPVWLAPTGRHVIWVDSPPGVAALQYERSPTDSTLVVEIPQRGLRQVLPDTAQGPVSVRQLAAGDDDSWVVSYFSAGTKRASAIDPSLTIGERVVSRFGQSGSPVGLAYVNDSVGAAKDGQLLLWLDPETTSSKIAAWSPKQVVTHLAYVLAFSALAVPSRALVAALGTTSLVTIEPGRIPRTVMTQATDLGVQTAYGTLLHSNPKVGVTLPSGESTSDVVEQLAWLGLDAREPEHLFDATLVGSEVLAWKGTSVGALVDYSIEQKLGKLCVRVLSTADVFCEPNVRSFAITTRPVPGVAYVARRGQEAQLFWAQAL